MPKVQTIINQIESKPFEQLPEVTHVLQSDIDRLNEALKKQKSDRSYYVLLRVVLAQVKKKLGHKDYTKPLLEISLSQLQGKPYINDLKLRICQAVIDCQEMHRVNMLQHTVNRLTSQNLKDVWLRGRLQVVRAGKQCFRGNYTQAAIYYLNASREQAFLKDQKRKIQLISKAIALSYVAARCSENHKTICSLCLNQVSKRSQLFQILNKLYTEDMMLREDCQKLQSYLPKALGMPDSDGVSVFSQAKFSHNMIPIMNSFKTIKFNTVTRLLSMDVEQVLILLEKTYTNSQIAIDQQQGVIQFIEPVQEGSHRLREYLNKIDEILELND